MGSYSSGEWTGTSSWVKGLLRVSWSSNGSAANSSNVTVTLYARRSDGGNSYNWSAGSNFWVSCNGSTRYSTHQQVSGSSWTTVASATFTVGHNSDGSKSVSIGGGGSIPGTTFNISSRSATITLDKIPRYTSIVTWVIADNSITQTSATFNWGVTDVISKLEYCIDDSSTWTSLTFDGKSGSFTCSTFEPGTKYKVKLRATRKDSGLTTTSSNIEVDTLPISTINIAGFLNDDNIFEFDIGKDIRFTVKDIDSNEYFVRFYTEVDSGEWGATPLLTKTGITFLEDSPSYILALSSIKDLLYQNCVYSNSKRCKIELGTIINDKEYINTYEGVFYVKDSDPIFGGFSLVNNNTKVNSLFTVNGVAHPEYAVYGFVDTTLFITSANRVKPKNYAIIEEYKVETKFNTLNTILTSSVKKENLPQSSANLSFSLPNAKNVGSYDITVWAIDSRGNETEKITKQLTILSYSAPTTYNISLSRLNQYERQIILNFSSDYTKLVVDGVQKNNITNIQYQCAIYSEEYKDTYTFAKNKDGTLANFSYSTSDNNSTINISRIMDESHGGYFVGNSTSTVLPDGFDSEKNYKVKFIISDELASSTVEILVSTGVPIMFRGSNGQVAIGKSPNEVFSNPEKFQVNGDIRFDYNGTVNTNITDLLKQIIVFTDSTNDGTTEPQNQQEGFLWFEIVDKIYDYDIDNTYTRLIDEESNVIVDEQSRKIVTF